MSSLPRTFAPPPRGVPVPGRRRRVLPGFGLSLGYTLTWLGLIVLIPLAGVFVHAAGLGWGELWRIWTEPRVLAALDVLAAHDHPDAGTINQGGSVSGHRAAAGQHREKLGQITT